MPTDVSPQQGASTAPTTADGDRTRLSDLSDIYEQGTFVLIGCGAAKRDPTDPADLRQATIGPDEEGTFRGGSFGETGPAWRAEDLYTSTYFRVKREFAETVTQWLPRPYDNGAPWAILSAEHHILQPFEPVAPYNTTIDDLADPNPPFDEAYDPPGMTRMTERRPDGEPLLTELDAWATRVALELDRWLFSAGTDVTDDPDDYFVTARDGQRLWKDVPCRSLLVLAGRDYVAPLRERDVFERGYFRSPAHPTDYVGPDRPEVTFLFDEIDADGIGEQMARLSDAVERLAADSPATEQAGIGEWS